MQSDRAPRSVMRSWRIDGYPLFDGRTRADFRKSFDKIVGMVGRLNKAGVTIVAAPTATGSSWSAR